MRVRTKPFGEMDVSERQLLSFPQGIYGFEDCRRFVLLDASQPPFYWLQSLDRPELAFVLLDPRVFLPAWSLDVSDDELEDLGGPSEEDTLCFVIVTIPADPAHMTANLQGPVVVNRSTRVGRQCISRNPDHGVRHRVLDAQVSGGR